MKRLYTGLALALTLMLAACTGTPRQQYANVNDAFIGAVTTLNAGYDAGEFTDEEWENEIEPRIVLGNLLMREYDSLTAGGFDGELTLENIQMILQVLRPYITRAFESD